MGTILYLSYTAVHDPYTCGYLILNLGSSQVFGAIAGEVFSISIRKVSRINLDFLNLFSDLFLVYESGAGRF